LKKVQKSHPAKLKKTKNDRKISKTKEANRTIMKKTKEYVKRRYAGYARPKSFRPRVDALTRANRRTPQKLGVVCYAPLIAGANHFHLLFFSIIC
jgi:hypothetical protein